MDELLPNSAPKLVREGVFFHSWDSQLIINLIGEERYLQLFGRIYKQLFDYPSFRFHKTLLANIISEMYLRPSDAINAGYNPIDIMATISTLQELATYFGLIPGTAIQTMHESGNSIQIDNERRVFTTYEDLKIYAQKSLAQGNIHGLVHGSFDPPHLGHARAIQSIWPYCNKIFVGVDGNEFLSSRKPGSPRFPLPWRLMELGQLPTVDIVFVLPFDFLPEEERWLEMYRILGIKIIGTGKDNILLPYYQKRMSALGGHVITEDREGLTSTHIVQRLLERHSRYSEETISMKEILNMAEQSLSLARKLGYTP